MSNNIGNNDSMESQEEAMSNGAENGRGMRRRSSHPSMQHEARTKRPQLSPDILSIIPEWMRRKVRTLNFTDHPTMQPIIEINVRHYNGDEMDVDTKSSFYNEDDVVDESDESME